MTLAFVVTHTDVPHLGYDKHCHKDMSCLTLVTANTDILHLGYDKR